MKKPSMFQRFMSWTRLSRNGRNGKAGGTNGLADSESCLAMALEEGAGCGEFEADAGVPAPVRVERLSQKEETILRIREGFKDLSNILGNINTNIQDQAESSRGIRDKIDFLPRIFEESRNGNKTDEELLGAMVKEASEAGLRQKEALQTLRALPVAMAAIQENEAAQYKMLASIRDEMAKRAQIEKEMIESFGRLDKTMDRIGDSARSQAEQIQNLGKSQKELVSSFNRVQNRTIETFQISQEQTFDEFRKAQSQALHAFQQTQEKMKRKFAWSVGVIAAILGITAIIFFGMWMRAVNDLRDGFHEVERHAGLVESRASALLQERDGEIQKLRNAGKGNAGAGAAEFSDPSDSSNSGSGSSAPENMDY